MNDDEIIKKFKERLNETGAMLEAVSRQLESWGHKPVVNITGCLVRNSIFIEELSK